MLFSSRPVNTWDNFQLVDYAFISWRLISLLLPCYGNHSLKRINRFNPNFWFFFFKNRLQAYPFSFTRKDTCYGWLQAGSSEEALTRGGAIPTGDAPAQEEPPQLQVRPSNDSGASCAPACSQVFENAIYSIWPWSNHCPFPLTLSSCLFKLEWFDLVPNSTVVSFTQLLWH